ncbi:MAG: SDR family NAD(P)-dependent oxidoreductase, partial [Bacteroidota bacterium]|nr:SDR family NAD(P)-dependent oxidoreductase [Bacteroidota bacterium]
MTNTKTALITGASKGLGYSLAEYLAHGEWNLLINARNANQLLTAKNELEKFAKVVAIAGDIRDEVHL